MKKVELGNNGRLVIEGKEMESKFSKEACLPQVRKKPGEGQARWRDGSYLTEEQKLEEEFNKKNGVS